MRVVIVEPNKPAYEAEIENNLDSYQKVVGGFIENVYNEDGTVIVVNEEGKLEHLKGNRRYGNDILVGTFFVTGTTIDDYRGLTDDEVKKYVDLFREPEEITDEEVTNSIRSGVIGFDSLEGMLAFLGI